MSDCTLCSDPLESGRRARGLCDPCYEKERRADRLADHPRSTWSRDDLMAEWELLRQDGYTRRQAADRLGVSYVAFDRAITRARAAGDPRAALGQAGGIYAAAKAVDDARAAIRAATQPAPPPATPPAPRELEHTR